jgi:thiamine biosynthesis protein ThiS
MSFVTVNGKSQALAALSSLLELLQHLNLDPARVAIEHNGVIVPQDRFAVTALHDGDRLEIVQFVGGG